MWRVFGRRRRKRHGTAFYSHRLPRRLRAKARIPSACRGVGNAGFLHTATARSAGTERAAPEARTDREAQALRDPMGNTDDSEGKFPPDLDDIRATVREELRAARRQEAAPEPLLTKEDAAEVLGVSLRTLDTLVASGEIGSIKVKRCRRIPPAALRSYIDRQAAGER